MTEDQYKEAMRVSNVLLMLSNKLHEEMMKLRKVDDIDEYKKKAESLQCILQACIATIAAFAAPAVYMSNVDEKMKNSAQVAAMMTVAGAIQSCYLKEMPFTVPTGETIDLVQAVELITEEYIKGKSVSDMIKETEENMKKIEKCMEKKQKKAQSGKIKDKEPKK